MAGHNGGFNPFRDANGEFTDPSGHGGKGRSRAGGSGAAAPATSRARAAAGSGAKASGGNTAGRRYDGARPGELGTRAERFNGTALVPRPGATPYRNRASLAATKPAAVNPAAKLTAAQRKAATAVVNTYAGKSGPRITAKSDNQTVVRLLRSTMNKQGPIMSYDESEQAQIAIDRLTRSK